MALGAVLSIAQAAVGFAAAQDQADAQNAAYEQNRVAAVAAANDRYASLANKTLQERASASEDMIQKKIEGLKARSTAAVAAGEGGVSGLSVNALLADYEAQTARKLEAIQLNYQTHKQANADEMVATYHNTVGRINSVKQAAGPNPAAFALQALGGIVGSATKSGNAGGLGIG